MATLRQLIWFWPCRLVNTSECLRTRESSDRFRLARTVARGLCLLTLLSVRFAGGEDRVVEVAAGAEHGLPDESLQKAALRHITDSSLRGHIRFLASDLLEGRAPGSRGDELAQQYVASQFESLGLLAAAPQGGWFQPVPLVGVTTHSPATLTFSQGDNKLELKHRDDYIVSSGKPAGATRRQ